MNLAQTKIDLYSALLHKEVNDLTESEIDLMYLLSKEPEIQERLDTHFKKKREGFPKIEIVIKSGFPK
jgi:hypothetical protein